MLDKTRKPLFPQLGTKKTFKKSGFFSFGKCRIVTKNVKAETLWDLLTYILLPNIKNSKPFETNKSHSVKKNQKGDPLVSSGFVGYVKKVKK